MTVPRIAACFPVGILQFIEMGVGRIIIDEAELTADPILKWLLHPAAASVLPVKTSSARAARLIIVTFGVCVLTDNLLHKKDGKYTPFESILQQSQTKPALSSWEWSKSTRRPTTKTLMVTTRCIWTPNSGRTPFYPLDPMIQGQRQWRSGSASRWPLMAIILRVFIPVLSKL